MHIKWPSYLSDREQFTCFLEEKSTLAPIIYGVPQGSVLGPLLFLLYINDMVNCINDEDVKLVLYADDTNIFIIGNDKNTLIQKGNQILKAVNEFMKSNLLHINLDTCYYMHFCPKAVKTKKIILLLRNMSLQVCLIWTILCISLKKASLR